MNRKTTITAALVCIALCVPVFSQSQDFEMNRTELVRYRGNAANVTIPVGVTVIGEYAFKDNKSLTSVTIPAGVTTIWEDAFSGCENLKSITLPAGVTSIGWGAFEETAWLNSQPDGLVYVGKVLYAYKGSMPANTVINNIRADTEAIAGGAFFWCENLTSITIPASVTVIEMYSFCGCTGLKSITIPAGVTVIGHGAFSDCSNLTSIVIPAGVTHIGQGAFYGCPLPPAVRADIEKRFGKNHPFTSPNI